MHKSGSEDAGGYFHGEKIQSPETSNNHPISDLSLARRVTIIAGIPLAGILSVGWILLEKYEDTTIRAVESAEALRTQGREVVESIDEIKSYADEHNLPDLAQNVEAASEDVATLVSILGIDPACLTYAPGSDNSIRVVENWCPEE